MEATHAHHCHSIIPIGFIRRGVRAKQHRHDRHSQAGVAAHHRADIRQAEAAPATDRNNSARSALG
jgi:hypothetical protein